MFSSNACVLERLCSMFYQMAAFWSVCAPCLIKCLHHGARRGCRSSETGSGCLLLGVLALVATACSSLALVHPCQQVGVRLLEEKTR